MKIKDIDGNIKISDLENFFDVYENTQDRRKPYLYNLNSTVYFSGTPKSVHKLSHDMFWTTISHEIYGTTRLWWILMKVNGVGMDRAFDTVPAGSSVRYVDKDVLNRVLTQALED